MFQFYLSHLHQILPGASEAEWDRAYRLLSSMHYSMGVSFAAGRPVSVRFWDCGFERKSFCIVPEPAPRFRYTDDRFLRACGISTADGTTIKLKSAARPDPLPIRDPSI